ncbi:SLC13 family permease [bacterium]|nr:SLC13 family permease [bacterium]
MNRGLWLAPAISIVLYFLPIPLSPEGHRMLAILGLATTLWVSEALPLPATALLIAVLVILFGIAPASEVFSIFADPLLFLFIGSFMLAEAMQVHGLDRRLAHGILRARWVRARAGRMVFVYCSISFLISMWVSNTATTAMLYPIGLSMIRIFEEQDRKTLAPLILLMTSFGSSIGGMATPVGTPPNLIGIGFLRELAGTSITFGQWMKTAVPISVATFLGIYFGMRLFYSNKALQDPMPELSTESVSAEQRRAQNNVALAFGITVFLWLLPSFSMLFGADVKWWESRLPESVVAIIGALLLFLLPVNWKERKFTITWKQAQNINWGIILLFGGGLVLGKFLFKTGVAEYLGDSLAAIYPFDSEFMYLLLFTLLAVFISEFTSNTASATLILPICIAVCQAVSIDPFRPALAATLASSLGFMLPVSTAPNAIVFGSGMIPIQTMIRYGVLLDLIGAFLVAVGVYFVA